MWARKLRYRKLSRHLERFERIAGNGEQLQPRLFVNYVFHFISVLKAKLSCMHTR